MPRAAVHERIEHEAEELAGRRSNALLLGAGRGLAGELRERVGEIAAGQTEHRLVKLAGSAPPPLKTPLIASRDVLLVLIERWCRRRASPP